jgi:hypothetical protein
MSVNRPKLKPIDAATTEKMVVLIRQLDFDWWFQRQRVPDVRKLCEKQFGMRISAKNFKELRDEHCEWFRVVRRKGVSHNHNLRGKQWDRLRAEVSRLAAELHGRKLDEAVAIVCALGCKCNATTLRGLGSDLHFWDKA